MMCSLGLAFLWYWLWLFVIGVFFFKQKTAYEMRISDWSSDVCSSDLLLPGWPIPIRTRRNSLPMCASVERRPLCPAVPPPRLTFTRSEEHTSELQSLMRISYAVFCLKKKKQNI